MIQSARVLQKYNNTKRDYYLTLRRFPGAKGNARALIGGLVWLLEKDLLESGTDALSAHTVAFSDAVTKVSLIRNRMELKGALTKVKSQWSGTVNHKLERKQLPELVRPPIDKIRDFRRNGMKAISLFSGAMGLDLGFMAAGFDVRLANDIDPRARETALSNLPSLAYINRDIDTVPFDELLSTSALRREDVDVLIGGPPCQPFSPAGKRMGLADPRASPLKYFIGAIKALRPMAFVMEEVPGLLSSRLRHISISERLKRPATTDEHPGSAFRVVMDMLYSTGYTIVYSKVNAADFGSPQARERVLFIGLRDGEPTIPVPTHSPTGKGGTKPWTTLWEATADISDASSDSIGFGPKMRRFMQYVPPGGNWREIPPDLVLEAMGGAYHAGGGKMGFYRRLSWDEPSPTVVTTPAQKGTVFVHPERERSLNILEYARIQGFPDDWQIIGTTADKYRLIGNAVPVQLSYAAAMHLRKILNGEIAETKGNIYAYEDAEMDSERRG